MVMAHRTKNGLKWAVLGASVCLVLTLVSYSQPSGVTLVQKRASPSHSGQDLTHAVSGIGQLLDSNAESLETSAEGLRQKAERQSMLAKQEQQMKEQLNRAQNELNAYAVNLEGMIAAGGDEGMDKDLAQFPREAAELHAYMDESLSKADTLGVDIANQEQESLSARSDSKTAQAQHLAHKKFMDFSHTMPTMSADPLKPAFPPKGWVSPQVDAAHKESKNAVGAKTNSKQSVGLADNAAVSEIMQKLRRVKMFAAKEADIKKSGKVSLPPHSVEKGQTSMLVQPPPLLGAMPVKGGELYREGPKYNPEDVVEAESEEEKEEDAFVNATNTTGLGLTPNQLVRACNETCQKIIVHSTLGLSFKVASKCVAACAVSPFILKKHGKPLPPWTTVDELQKQDAECKEDDTYQECKLEELDPVCDKFSEVMPHYCPSHQKESICALCGEMEIFEEKKKAAEDAKLGKKSSDCLLGILC